MILSCWKNYVENIKGTITCIKSVLYEFFQFCRFLAAVETLVTATRIFLERPDNVNHQDSFFGFIYML